MEELQLIKKLIDHYNMAIDEYEETKDFNTLVNYNVDEGVCHCITSYFRLKLQDYDFIPDKCIYWTHVPEYDADVELNVWCLEERVRILEEKLAYSNPNQLKLFV